MKKMSLIIAAVVSIFSTLPTFEVSANEPMPFSSFTYSNSTEFVKALEQDFGKKFLDEYSAYYDEEQVQNVSDFLTKINDSGVYTINFNGLETANSTIQLFLNDLYGEPNLYFPGNKSETGIQYMQLFYPDTIQGESTLEVLNYINPNGSDSDIFYPAYTTFEEQMISIAGEETDCVVGMFDGDDREYITFVYDDVVIRIVGNQEQMESVDALNTIRIENLTCNIDLDFMTKELGEVTDAPEEQPKNVTNNYNLTFASAKEMEDYFMNVIAGDAAVPFDEDCTEADFDHFIEFLNFVNLKGMPEFEQDITSVGIRYTGLYGYDASIVYNFQSDVIDHIETIFVSDDLASQTSENGIAWLYGTLTIERNVDYLESYTVPLKIHGVDEPVQALVGRNRIYDHNVQEVIYLDGNNYVLIKLKNDCTVDDIVAAEKLTYKSCPISASILMMKYSDIHSEQTTTTESTTTISAETTTETSASSERTSVSTTIEPLDARFDMEFKIVDLPNKTEYIWGDSLDLTGLTANLTLIGGDGERISILVEQPLSELPSNYNYIVDGDTSTLGEPEIMITVSTLNQALNHTVTASDTFNIVTIHVMPMETETTAIDVTTTTTTTTTINHKNITQEDLENWAKNDYEYRTGQVAVSENTIVTSDGDYEITLADENGTVLDVYTVNPETAEGTNQSGEEVNLPQTGITSKTNYIIFIGGLSMIVFGIFAIFSSGMFKRKDEN